jgi:hypothetical protein
MGSTNWSASLYSDRASLRADVARSTGKSVDDIAFAYHADVASGRASGPHKSLDPKGVVFRESRDSDVHPESMPIAILLDVTGSMSTVPRQIQASLPKLMSLLIRKGYVEHPAILVGAIGDATCDRVPLQVGQFESGIEIEDNLTNLVLEAGGGGQQTESYELALYFLARHTAHDHWEKRGQRGYLFIIGDENPYPQVKPDEVEAVIGNKLGEAVPVEQILAEVRERYNVFYVLPRMTSNFNDAGIRKRWKQLLGENVLLLDEPAGICELIASQIGLWEGTAHADKIADDLVDAGASASIAGSVSRALVPAGAVAAKGKAMAQALPSSGAPSGVAKF